MRKTFSFLGGLILGLITGGSVALLLAPESGPELQREIKDYVDHLIEEGKMAADARRREMEQQLDAFKRGRPVPSTTSET
jgi:gas vesicle protein